MNQDTKLKLQAYLDHELSEQESRQMADLVDRDQDARLLYGELMEAAALLNGNELEVKCPESREFYWSKIERAIAHSSRQASAPELGRGHYWWWSRLVAPALGVTFLLMMGLWLLNPAPGPGRLSYRHEFETPLDET